MNSASLLGLLMFQYTRVATKPNKSWKRCSAHVYISRLIKVLKISEREEGSPVTPTQPTTSGCAELQAHARINGRNGDTHFSALDIFHAKKDSSEIQNGIFHKRPIQDQQMASETSAICSSKQVSSLLIPSIYENLGFIWIINSCRDMTFYLWGPVRVKIEQSVFSSLLNNTTCHISSQKISPRCLVYCPGMVILHLCRVIIQLWKHIR